MATFLIEFTHKQMQMHLHYFKEHIKIYIKIHINIAPTCFGLVLNLTKVIFMLKHSVKLRRYFTECFNINITLAMFSASSLMMVEERNM